MAKTPESRQGSRESADAPAADFQPHSRPEPAKWEGERVVLVGDHPWSGHSGTVESEEILLAREALKIKLDTGTFCTVFDLAQVRRVDIGD